MTSEGFFSKLVSLPLLPRRLWRERFDADPNWHPGKEDEEEKGTPGRKKVITKAQETTIAQSAMNMKRKGLVPTVAAVIAQCPKATLNPETEEPFTSKVICEVFKTRCYDDNHNEPWTFRCPKQKTCLSPELIELRRVWGDKMLAINHQAGWYFRHIVWFDPCYTIVPGRPKTIHDQQQYRFGKAGRWMSGSASGESRNMRPSPYTNKTCQWGDEKVWWFMVLAMGKVHIHVVERGWQQDGEGQGQLVKELPKVLRKMLGTQVDHPKVLFTDRGPGFYHASSGNICTQYQEAVTEHGFQTWAGENSKWQPPDIADLLLHETAVAWARKYMKQHPVKIGSDMEKNIAEIMLQNRKE